MMIRLTTKFDLQNCQGTYLCRKSRTPCIHCCQSLELLLEKLVILLISILVLLMLLDIEVGNLIERFFENLPIPGKNLKRILWHSQVWTISNHKLISICLKSIYFFVFDICLMSYIFPFLFFWWSYESISFVRNFIGANVHNGESSYLRRLIRTKVHRSESS